MLFPASVQPIVDASANVRVRDVDVISVYIDMQPIPFNRGYYSIDLTFFFDVSLELYGGLFEMLGAEAFQRHLERGSIEVAPLAYMRGRTLDNAFIILDEAQNTTGEQMKMFLTRLGDGSRMVITGDTTQIDLPDKQKSGLVIASRILRKVNDIAICEFTNRDVVRHKLVQDIIRAYEAAEQKQAHRKPEHTDRKDAGKH